MLAEEYRQSGRRAQKATEGPVGGTGGWQEALVTSEATQGWLLWNPALSVRFSSGDEGWFTG